MKNKPEIIFINQYTGYLFIDIVNAFAEDHACELFAGQVDPAKAPLNTAVKRRRLIKYNRKTGFKRIYTWLVFSIQSFFWLLFRRGSYQLFIVSNPPFAPFLGYFFHKIMRTKYHLLIYDVYPDALVQMNVAKKGGLVERTWSRINRHLYKNASSVFTLSENMAGLIRLYYADVNVQVIPNWTDTSFIRPISKTDNFFAKQYLQFGKVTVMYSGNMGATHAVEKIADLAYHFKGRQDFSFFAVGDGAKKGLIQKMKEEKCLDNLEILPYQPAEMLPFLLACADIGIVTLSSGAEDISVPSKTYNLLAAGVALLVIASRASELAALVRKHQCGAVFEEHETEAMIAFIKEMKEKPMKLQELKQNARKASYSFTSANAYQYKYHLKKEMNVPEIVEACE